MTDDAAEILFEVDDGVLNVTLNRPDAGNAVTLDQRAQLMEWLERANEDHSIRCVVLGATGRFFCTGADLRVEGAAEAERPEGAPERIVGDVRRAMTRGAIRVVNAIIDCEKPVIAKVQGTAAGIGCHLAFACDLVIASDNAKFIEVFARRGLAADGLGAWMLPRLVGLQRAKEMVLLADDVPAARAYEIGLVTKVVARRRARRHGRRAGAPSRQRPDQGAHGEQVAAQPFARQRPPHHGGRGSVDRRRDGAHRRLAGRCRELRRAAAAELPWLLSAQGLSPPTRQVDALALRDIDWTRLFAPRRVVVIGATDTENTQPRAQFEQVRERMTARGADVVPVHPTKPDILGTTAYPSILDVPGDVDVAVVLVRDALTVVEQCKEKGVGFTVVFSAGFGEVGTERGRRRRSPAARAGERRHARARPEHQPQHLRAVAAGVAGPHARHRHPVGLPGTSDHPGPGARASPSSAGPRSATRPTSSGPTSSATSATSPVSVRSPPTSRGSATAASFMLAADRAARAGVPIVAIKVGRSDEGAAMAQAHTGHLTGSDAVHDAVFEQFGVIRVDDLDEVIEMSGMFCHVPAADRADPRTADLRTADRWRRRSTRCRAAPRRTSPTSAGCTACPSRASPTRRSPRSASTCPAYLSDDNPLDSGGVITARPENRTVLELMRDDPNIDILFAPITGVFPGMSDALAQDLIALHQEGTKPVITAWISPIRDEAHQALCDAGVPLFHSFGAAILGMKALARAPRRSRATT